MKISFSNIAWAKQEDHKVAAILKNAGFSGVEIAPTKIWEDPTSVKDLEIRKYKDFWKNEGLAIPAIQSILFGKPDLILFGDSNSRKKLLDHCKKMITVSASLGSKIIVFGSPKNRQKGALSTEAALDIAIPFFKELGDFAQSASCLLCIEANATQYNCDFITTSTEADEIVKSVNSAGFGLHLDLACMEMAGEDPGVQSKKLGLRTSHFHISNAHLSKVEESQLLTVKAALPNLKPEAWLSIEMRENTDPNRAVQTVQDVAEKANQILTLTAR